MVLLKRQIHLKWTYATLLTNTICEYKDLKLTSPTIPVILFKKDKVLMKNAVISGEGEPIVITCSKWSCVFTTIGMWSPQRTKTKCKCNTMQGLQNLWCFRCSVLDWLDAFITWAFQWKRWGQSSSVPTAPPWQNKHNWTGNAGSGALPLFISLHFPHSLPLCRCSLRGGVIQRIGLLALKERGSRVVWVLVPQRTEAQAKSVERKWLQH